MMHQLGQQVSMRLTAFKLSSWLQIWLGTRCGCELKFKKFDSRAFVGSDKAFYKGLIHKLIV